MTQDTAGSAKTTTDRPDTISVLPATDDIRAINPQVLRNARYVAALTSEGRVVDVLAIHAVDMAEYTGLRDYARRAADGWHLPYVETGAWCDYCNRICPPDVAGDHARWARGSETTARAAA